MKLSTLKLKSLFIFFLIICSCATRYVEKAATNNRQNTKIKLPDNFNPNKSGYIFMNKTNTVKFIYDPSAYKTKILPEDKIYVLGSFNGWQKSIGSKNWEMKKDKKVYILEKPYEQLFVKGAGGDPEFKFLKNKNEWQEPNYIDKKYTQGRNLFINKDVFRKQDEISGYLLSDDIKKVTFIFQPEVYDPNFKKNNDIFVVGTFNKWAEAIGNPDWKLKKTPGGIYTLEKNVSEIDVPGGSGYPEFKFVTDKGKWQQIDKISSKYKKNNNLWVNFDIHGDITPPTPSKAVLTGKSRLVVTFSEPLNKNSAENSVNYVLKDGTVKSATLLPNLKDVKLVISPIDIEAENYVIDNQITITGISDKNGVKMKRKTTLPLTISRPLLKKFFDSIPAVNFGLGAVIEKEKVDFRLFGPRLKNAEVLLYKNSEDKEPFKKLKMNRGNNFIWSADASKKEIPHGTFYKFLIHKSEGDFLVNDPYTKASVGSAGKSIVIYHETKDAPFTGWQDKNYTTPSKDKIIIYETHIADLTGKNPACSDIPHTFLAMTIDKPGSPLNYLRKLGINAVEFLPLHEYQNGAEINFMKHYSWGYMTSLYFAPESSFSTDPAGRKQVSELKKMVDTLHKNGIAVIVDVVFNHTSNADNALGMIDSEYYFTGGNKSGCGNDTYCSRPMMRKLILDSLNYWLKEYHIDGFRFDLSHLIDQKNLFTAENIAKLESAKMTKGNLILIAEDWSNNRAELKNTTVARWNDSFREDVKDFISRGKKKNSILDRIRWSKDKNFYANPMETVNYIESHDEETIANRLNNEEWTNKTNIINRAKMAGIILLTSQGIPMILEGQAVMRDKDVQTQDYKSNVIDWNLMKNNSDFLDFYKKLIALRMKNPVLRLAEDQPNSFYKSLKTKNKHAAGYVLNADSSIKNEPKIVVLLNPSKNVAEFILPEGKWKLIADEKEFYEKEGKEIDGKIILEEGAFILGMQK